MPIRHQEQPLREEEGKRKLTPVTEDPINGVSFQGGQGEVYISLEIRHFSSQEGNKAMVWYPEDRLQFVPVPLEVDSAFNSIIQGAV